MIDIVKQGGPLKLGGIMGQRYLPDRIREWSHYLRRVANRLNDSLEDSEARLARHFYNVHYAIGPDNLTESDIFALNENHLELIAGQDGEKPEKVIRELIDSLRIIVREGDNLGQEFMNQSVWNSGLKDYLCELRENLISLRKLGYNLLKVLVKKSQ